MKDKDQMTRARPCRALLAMTRTWPRWESLAWFRAKEWRDMAEVHVLAKLLLCCMNRLYGGKYRIKETSKDIVGNAA